MTRRRWTDLRRAALFMDHDGVCHICGGKIGVGDQWDLDHIIPLALGGADDETNAAPAHVSCHRGAGSKTSDDQKAIAKANRVHAKHIGAREPSRMPGSRNSKYRKRLDGSVVLRNPEERSSHD